MERIEPTIFDAQQSLRSFNSAARWLSERVGQEFRRESGMWQIHYEMLSWLSEAPEGQLGLTKLARRMGISTSRLSHLVDRAQEHGWVERAPDPVDLRIVLARLTDAGKDALRAATPLQLACVRSRLIERLTPAQVEQLREISEALIGRSANSTKADSAESGHAGISLLPFAAPQ
ncbi:MarR family winged helix-turn-helix transcriptional regulator [Streptomyces sp. NPDC002817]|uniref:MarR family winged helix-turn-helix transcriptional regulator n=1 Tax=Streptomyces sp. NPDC088357 TaxID=3154655 RepID=UPI003420840C